MTRTMATVGIAVLLIALTSVPQVFAGGAGEVEEMTIRAGLIDPPDHIDVKATERMADLVYERTDGQIEIETYPAAELGAAMDMLEGMTVGTIDMFVGAVTWLGAFETDFWLPGTLYVFNDQAHSREVHHGEYFQSLAERMVDEYGIRVLTMDWDRGPRNIISTTPVETPEDLEGLSIRVPEQDSWIANFDLAGADPTPIALAETFTGLQQGVIDATEQASNWLLFNRYHTVADNLSLTHHNFEQSGVFISEDVYAQLTPEFQEIVREAAQEVSDWHNEMVLEEIEAAEEEMEMVGINLIEVDRDVWRDHFRDIFPTLADRVGYDQALVDEVMEAWE